MYNDPTQANFGRAKYGQIAPRQSAELDQYQNKMRNPRLGALQGGMSAEQSQQMPQDAPAEPPHRAALARPPAGAMGGGAMGAMGSMGSAQGKLQPMASQMAPPQGRPMSTHNQAYQQLQELAQSGQAPPRQAIGMGQTQGGLQPQQPAPQPKPPMQAMQQQAPMQQQQQSFQPPAGNPAQQAYQEYMGEFGPDDSEQPMSFQQFEALFSQLPEDQVSAMSAPEPQAAPQFARQGFNGINLDVVGNTGASPMGLLGFNNDRAFSGGDENSMKDAMGRAFATNPMDLRGKSKEEVGAYLASPDFEAHMAQSGLKKGVHWDVKPGEYDILMVNSAERGWEPVDVVGSAGSGDAVWTYQALMDAQQGGGNPMQGALMQGVDPSTGLPSVPQGNEGDPAYWQQILAQLQQDMDAQRKSNPNLFTEDM